MRPPSLQFRLTRKMIWKSQPETHKAGPYPDGCWKFFCPALLPFGKIPAGIEKIFNRHQGNRLPRVSQAVQNP